jgi:hypothetical protein
MLNYDINGYGNTVLHRAAGGRPNPQLVCMMETCAASAIDACGSTGCRRATTVRLAHQDLRRWRSFRPRKRTRCGWSCTPRRGAAPGLAPSILATIHTPNDVPEKLDVNGIALARRLQIALVRRVSEMR